MKIDKKLFRHGPYSDFFSQGVQVGNILTLAGQLGNSGDGKRERPGTYRDVEVVEAGRVELPSVSSRPADLHV